MTRILVAASCVVVGAFAGFSVYIDTLQRSTTTKAVAESLYEEFKAPLYAAPPLLQRMVDAGLLGRKTGRGFYEY